MASIDPPLGATPPLCGCGCRESVKWKPGVGWFQFAGRGHALRGQPGPRRGVKVSEETRKRMSDAATTRWKGTRLRDTEPSPGLGVYTTAEYKAARAAIAGKPCVTCGSSKRMHAHHVIPGNDASLIPLCGACHAREHRRLEGVDISKVNGASPPPGAVPPLCKCGCGKPVLWKRVRGWGSYLRGHGNAKVPAGTSSGKNPLCACGCGEPVSFRGGRGWCTYRRGHGQRVEGHYTAQGS